MTKSNYISTFSLKVSSMEKKKHTKNQKVVPILKKYIGLHANYVNSVKMAI